MRQPNRIDLSVLRMVGLLAAACALPVFAQLGPAPAKPKPAASAREGAPVDLTGYWVSVVTEDWRWRMVTPIKGDFASIPLTPAARAAGEAWDPDADIAAGDQCKAYGAPALLRVPGRLHITWEDDNTLRIDSDQGEQTRLLHFAAPGRPDSATPRADLAASRQGYSQAQWEGPVRGPNSPQQGLGATRVGTQGRSLEVTTTNLLPGYLRRNGAPYSGGTVLKEFFDLSVEANGDTWFVVTTIVEDPQSLTEPFVTSTNFKQEPDGSKFSPAACSAK